MSNIPSINVQNFHNCNKFIRLFSLTSLPFPNYSKLYCYTKSHEVIQGMINFYLFVGTLLIFTIEKSFAPPFYDHNAWLNWLYTVKCIHVQRLICVSIVWCFKRANIIENVSDKYKENDKNELVEWCLVIITDSSQRYEPNISHFNSILVIVPMKELFIKRWPVWSTIWMGLRQYVGQFYTSLSMLKSHNISFYSNGSD